MATDPQGRPDGLDIPADLLDIDPERMRELGYWVVDRTIEHLTSLGERAAVSTADHADLMRLLGGPLPLEPSSVEEGLVALADVALENQQHGDHPRYFARVPGPSSYAAILGDWLAIGMQSIASSWGGGSGTKIIYISSAKQETAEQGYAFLGAQDRNDPRASPVRDPRFAKVGSA